jgi:hypothetical protein
MKQFARLRMIRRASSMVGLGIGTTILGWTLLAHAADDAPAAPVSTAQAPPTAAATPPAPRLRAVPVGSAHAESADEPSTGKGTDATTPKFSATDKWILAGYNNNELVYKIIVSNEDSRIIHCTALMQGWYYENGEKLSISDRQSVTVFPNQPTEVGNWMDMDQKSGTTYSVKCRPI